MKPIYKICIISDGYPTENDPFFTFVQQLAYSLTAENCNCQIIAPQSLTKVLIRRTKRKPYLSEDNTPCGKSIRVIRPYTLSFSNTKIKFLCRLSQWSSRRAIKKGLKKAGKVDVVYCYFWHMGLAAASLLQKSKSLLIVQASECEISVSKRMCRPENLKRVDGVVCASGKNQRESIDHLLTTEDKTRIVVNGYRPDTFFKMDKKEVRAKLGFPQESFIVAFVGGFIQRKGIIELCEALNKFPDVYSIFIGRGQYQPFCQNILFSGPVEHNRIVEYLNCADIFVLPTKAEGCCNAIIEALACGLPVVSSNKSFNNEILDDKCSIRVNENNVDEIYDAIKRFKESPQMTADFSEYAIEKSKELTIDRRASKIIAYIRELNK